MGIRTILIGLDSCEIQATKPGMVPSQWAKLSTVLPAHALGTENLERAVEEGPRISQRLATASLYCSLPPVAMPAPAPPSEIVSWVLKGASPPSRKQCSLAYPEVKTGQAPRLGTE